MEKRILVIEDNEDLANLLEINLKDEMWAVELCHNGRTGFRWAQKNSYDLIVLDIMLPGMDGLEILKQLRTKENHVPVLMLTSKSSEIDRVLGLEFGADDYVTKPFSVRELIARVKAIFRRVEMVKSENQNRTILKRYDLLIDPEKRKVVEKNNLIDLTAKEFDLLYFFANNPGRVFNRAQLLDRVWGYGHDGYEHTVNSNINRLRAKIEADPADPKVHINRLGCGI